MNTQQYPFWLRFIFFAIVFSIAFLLIIFVIDRNPFEDAKMLVVKIGAMASLSSLLYNVLLESDPEIVD
jgi:hypothetical protein